MSCDETLNNEKRYIQNQSKVRRGFDFRDFREIKDDGGAIASAVVVAIPTGVLVLGAATPNADGDQVEFMIETPTIGSKQKETKINIAATLVTGEILRNCGTVVSFDC